MAYVDIWQETGRESKSYQGDLCILTMATHTHPLLSLPMTHPAATKFWATTLASSPAVSSVYVCVIAKKEIICALWGWAQDTLMETPHAKVAWAFLCFHIILFHYLLANFIDINTRMFSPEQCRISCFVENSGIHLPRHNLCSTFLKRQWSRNL